MKLSTKIAAVAVAVVAGPLATGIAMAGTPSADGTITACVKADGTPRIVDTEAGQTCASGERSLAWSSGWRHRGTYDRAKTYAVGDVAVLPKPCGTIAFAFQNGRSTWVKTGNGPNPYCLFDTYHVDTATWRPVSLPPSTPPQEWDDQSLLRIGKTDWDAYEVWQTREIRTFNSTGGAWLNIKGLNAKYCAVNATPVSSSPVVVTRADYDSLYPEWIYLATAKPTGELVNVPLDVLIDCAVY